MLVKIFGSALCGVDAQCITIETSVEPGVNFFLVGLPDSAVKESQQRIEAALSHNGFRLPGKKIVINMAPADLRKEGAAYDLPLAIGILAASEQIPSDKVSDYLMMGELSLDGGVRPIKGALPMAIAAHQRGFRGMFVPVENAEEAAIVEGLEVYGVRNLREVTRYFQGVGELQACRGTYVVEVAEDSGGVDFSEVKGQESIKRALEITAAGGHNVLLIGPPGSGKTMLAKRMPTILPPLTMEEALETTKIHSVAGRLGRNQGLIRSRPFRAPHHSISDVALVGGGSIPQPGEISLAHHGVLFLDEMPEFKRNVLEVLRQPMEERRINVARARFSVDYPAAFMLVAAMNPCPCGYYNHPTKACTCPSGAVARYLQRISGPLLDRMDLHVEVSPVDYKLLSTDSSAESSSSIRTRVVAARERQKERFAQEKEVHCNAQMGARQLRRYAPLTDEGKNLLLQAMEKLSLSARAYDRIVKVARTIADLEQCDVINTAHLSEAIHFRSLDREGWGR